MTVRGRIGGFGVLIPESRSRPSAVGFTTVTDSTVGSGRHPVERGVGRGTRRENFPGTQKKGMGHERVQMRPKEMV